MSINANNSKNIGSGSSQILPIEAGTYPARLVMVVDLGLQPQPAFQGQEKPPAYTVLTSYEFLDEFLKDEDGEDMLDKPRWLSEFFPLYSLGSERAKSTKRYNALDTTGVHNGNWGELLETPCMVTVVINEGKKGPRNNISNVSPMRPKEAEKAPKLVNEALSFDMDSPSLEAFNRLPAWIQERIKNGLEFKGSKLDSLLSSSPTGKPVKEKAANATAGDLEDENPF